MDRPGITTAWRNGIEPEGTWNMDGSRTEGQTWKEGMEADPHQQPHGALLRWRLWKGRALRC